MLYDSYANLLNKPVVLKKIEKEPARPISRITEIQGSVTFEDLLVAVGATRNRDAFIRVFEHFAPRVKSFLMKGGLTQELADELAQETMLTVWRKAASYDPRQAAASTWIYTIARNKRIDYLRKAARPEPDANDPLLTPDTILQDEALGRLEQERALSEAIRQLPEEQARLIRKSFFEEKNHAEIAAETGIPLGTVKSRIRLGLQRLRRNLGAKNQEITDESD